VLLGAIAFLAVAAGVSLGLALRAFDWASGG
jgi:hypothetical protein